MPELKRSAIEKTARFWPDRFTLLIVFIAVLGAVHILVRTSTYGAAVGVDATVYLSTAVNLLAGEGLQHFAGGKLVWYPPLFSLLLAAIGLLGIEPLEAGRWVNAAAFGLTILAAGLWLYRSLRSPAAPYLALAASVVLMASFPLNDIASKLLTEPLFVLFTLLALMQLASFLNRRTAHLPLMLAGVFTALATVTRYPGVALIFAGVLLLLAHRTPPFAARLKYAFVFGAVSSIPLAAALARNWAISGTLTGGRNESELSLFDSLRQVAYAFRKWLVPPNAPDGSAYLLWLAVGLVVLAGAAVVLRSTKMQSDGGRVPTRDAPAGSSAGGWNDGEAAPAYFSLGPAIPFGAFVLVYLVFMVAVAMLPISPKIYSRYLLPVYVPLLLAAVFLLDRFLCIGAAGRVVTARWVLVSLILIGASLHVGFSAQRNLSFTAIALESGYWNLTYNVAYWENSEALNYIRTNRSDSGFYTNNPYLAWFRDRTAAPEKYQSLPPRIPDLAQSMMRWTEDGAGADIVWFYGRNGYNYDAIDVRLLPGVETVAELSDGVVFRVTAAEPFDEDRYRAKKERYVDGLIEQASERVVRSGFDVYFNGRRLTYLKQPCAPADTKAKFVVHVIPADPDDLPAHRKRYGYDNFGFYFDQRGVRLDDQCIAIAHLPDYAIARIRTGQWIRGEGHVWKAEFDAGAIFKLDNEQSTQAH